MTSWVIVHARCVKNLLLRDEYIFRACPVRGNEDKAEFVMETSSGQFKITVEKWS